LPAPRLVEGDELRVRIGLEAVEEAGFLEMTLRVRNDEGVLLFSSFSGQRDERMAPGEYRFDCLVEPEGLRPGRYWVELAATTAGGVQDLVPRALAFEVEQGAFVDQNPRYLDGSDGLFRVASRWSVAG
jgi:hypothetical protein